MPERVSQSLVPICPGKTGMVFALAFVSFSIEEAKQRNLKGGMTLRGYLLWSGVLHIVCYQANTVEQYHSLVKSKPAGPLLANTNILA